MFTNQVRWLNFTDHLVAKFGLKLRLASKISVGNSVEMFHFSFVATRQTVESKGFWSTDHTEFFYVRLGLGAYRKSS